MRKSWACAIEKLNSSFIWIDRYILIASVNLCGLNGAKSETENV